MPRTTLHLDPSVLRELRRRGKREGKSMGEVASEALAQALVASGAATPPPLEWTSSELGRPMVDLEDAERARACVRDPLS